MNPPTVGGKFAAKDVGGGVPDAPGGIKTPPYDAKDKGDTMARLRAGHARHLRGGVDGWRKVRGQGCRGRRPRRPAEGSRPLPTMQKIKGRQWQGCGPGMPGPYGLLFPATGVRGRLAAHNERRQFASQTRSCGCLPRRGKHCSHPGFAPLNRGPCSQPRNPSLRCKR